MIDLEEGDQFNWHDDPAGTVDPDVEVLEIYEDEDGNEQVRIEDLGETRTVSPLDFDEAVEYGYLSRVSDE